MTEYEWETRRIPRPGRPEFLANYHPHVRGVAEFAALEHPRESVGWILKQHSLSKGRPSTFRRNRKEAVDSEPSRGRWRGKRI